MAKRKGTGVVLAGLAGLAASYLSKKKTVKSIEYV